MPWVSSEVSSMHRHRVFDSTTLTYCEIEDAQSKQHIVLIGVADENAQFVVLVGRSKQFEADRI